MFQGISNSNSKGDMFQGISNSNSKGDMFQGDSNSNILIFKVIVIAIITLTYYTDLGGISNSNSNLLIFKVIVIVIYYIAM